MEVADVAVIRGEEELFARTAHLFAAASDVACAARDLHTWAVARPESQPSSAPPAAQHRHDLRVRKIYRPSVLLDEAAAEHLRRLAEVNADIRIAADDLNETIILDRRVAILAGDRVDGVRGYSVLTRQETVQGIASLFEAAWRGATELAVYDARLADVRTSAARILDLLASGCKDETAARALGVGVRTYRRRVADLMAALGATSRFQAGARARELGVL